MHFLRGKTWNKGGTRTRVAVRAYRRDCSLRRGAEAADLWWSFRPARAATFFGVAVMAAFHISDTFVSPEDMKNAAKDDDSLAVIADDGDTLLAAARADAARRGSTGSIMAVDTDDDSDLSEEEATPADAAAASPPKVKRKSGGTRLVFIEEPEPPSPSPPDAEADADTTDSTADAAVSSRWPSS